MTALKQIARSAGTVGGAVLLSRIAGLVRDMVMSSLFGAGPVADAIYVANMLPNLFRRLVAEGAPVASFISIFTKLKQEEGEEAGVRFAETFWTLMTIVVAIMTLAGVFGARPIVWAFTNPAFRADPNRYELTVTLTRLMFPYLFFIALVALAMGILNSYKKFFAPAISQFEMNLIWIAAVVFLHQPLGAHGMSVVVGVLVGGVAQLALQLPWLWKVGMRFRPRFNFSHPGLKRIGLLILPSTFAVGISQINTIVSNYYITANVGGRSWFYYANRLTEFPFGLISFALATAILPTLSEQADKSRRELFVKTFTGGLRLNAFLMIPASVGLILIGHPLIELLFQHGKFGPADTEATNLMLIAFCAGLPAMAGHRMVVQAFYAVEDMVSPVWTAALSMVINLAAAKFLSDRLGPTGVPLALSLAITGNLVLLALLLPRRLDGQLRSHGLWGVVLKSAVGSAAMAVPVLAIHHFLWSSGAPIVVKGLVLAAEIGSAGAVYAAVAYALGVQELSKTVDALRRRLQRGKR